ncbi:MAG: hypothetical protein WDO15_12945 [Bacteroidota bacterium]
MEAPGRRPTITGPTVGAIPTYKSMVFSSASTFYLSLANVGIYKTINTGAGWTSVDKGFQAHNLNQIVLTDNGRLLVSRDYGFGLYMSTDDGVSWDFVGTNNLTKSFPTLRKVGSTIYAFGQGIVKTIDNAANWTVVHNGTSTPFLNSFTMPLTNDGITIYSFDNYDNSGGESPTYGLWKSVNSGSTFTRSTIGGLPASNISGFTNDHATAMDSNGNIYMLIYTYATGATSLWKIPNGATTATQITNTGVANLFDLGAKNSKVYITGELGKLVVSGDGRYNLANKTLPTTQF